MNPFFPEIKKVFGFGMMRLPVCDGKVDMDLTEKMVDRFLAAGFNYFDTAHPYLDGQSEEAVRRCLSSRYPRDRYVLANKLSFRFFETEAEIRPFFQRQLEICGVDYFDFYLIHANSAARHPKFTETRAYDILQELKAEGKIRHVGMSFHDSAAVLEQILTDRPEIEFVQIQFNYADYEDPSVESRKCYEVCRKLGKPVFIMEPVKGGSLINLPRAALELMDESPANYAIRYAAGFEGVEMVLSGMSDMAQMEENISFMEDFQPLSPSQQEILRQVRTIYQAHHRIPCTGCRYCTEVCPAGIPIPEILAWVNAKSSENPPEAPYDSFTPGADQCLTCGQCEAACPQHLQIPDLLKQIQEKFG